MSAPIRTVVIPTNGRRPALLSRCLDTLVAAAEFHEHPVELVVACNGDAADELTTRDSEGSLATELSAPFLRGEGRSLVESGYLRVEFIRGGDHVFTPQWSQVKLVEVIRSWMVRWKSRDPK